MIREGRPRFLRRRETNAITPSLYSPLDQQLSVQILRDLPYVAFLQLALNWKRGLKPVALIHWG